MDEVIVVVIVVIVQVGFEDGDSSRPLLGQDPWAVQVAVVAAEAAAAEASSLNTTIIAQGIKMRTSKTVVVHRIMILVVDVRPFMFFGCIIVW